LAGSSYLEMLVSFVIIIIIIISIYSTSTAEPHCRYTLSSGCAITYPSSTHIRVYNGTVQLFPPFLFTFFFLGAPIHTQITAGSFEKQKNFIF
jgi:hypothetical protein